MKNPNYERGRAIDLHEIAKLHPVKDRVIIARPTYDDVVRPNRILNTSVGVAINLKYFLAVKISTTKLSKRKVYVYDRNGNEVCVFDTIQAAALALNSSVGHIGHTCRANKDASTMYSPPMFKGLILRYY